MTAVILAAHSCLIHTGATDIATFSGAVYTALLAPFLIGPLQKAKRMFGFESRRCLSAA
jgi:hypothetical protein